MTTLEDLYNENTKLRKIRDNLWEANNRYQQAYRDEKLLVKKGVVAVEALTDELLRLKEYVTLLEGALEYHTDLPKERALHVFKDTFDDVDPDTDSMEF